MKGLTSSRICISVTMLTCLVASSFCAAPPQGSEVQSLPDYPCRIFTNVETPSTKAGGVASKEGDASVTQPAGTQPPRQPHPSKGRLPAEVIQKVVREHFQVLHGCYENGAERNPQLTGRVSVRFVIGPDGTVLSPNAVCTSMPDKAVVSCVVDVFRQLPFPQPEGGSVTVVYPLLFSVYR
jgi:outer membrane biosynthesis protein TonB